LKGIQNTARGSKVAKTERARIPRAFYTSDYIIKPYSADDATYYGSLKLSLQRTDELIAGFNNTITPEAKLCYMALTTQYITVVDESSKVVCHFSLDNLIRILLPDDNMISFEYKTSKVCSHDSREMFRGSS
jgi:hypothetical protein